MAYNYQPSKYWVSSYWPISYWPGLVYSGPPQPAIVAAIQGTVFPSPVMGSSVLDIILSGAAQVGSNSHSFGSPVLLGVTGIKLLSYADLGSDGKQSILAPDVGQQGQENLSTPIGGYQGKTK